MAIDHKDVARIAQLARLELTPEAAQRALSELNGIFDLIQQLQAVDTQGIEPMAHPLSAHQEITLRLRPDAAAPTHTLEQRQELMSNAPAASEGLFLVPTVLE
ncbi:Asp-tRNA(Asn)/Glu-tRNA(Gln) amidotransferase subunit GatC [Candidimonas humi]|jgi:aspartyl-tRNA(Asn)/glutamyl-tRNA(Gln) amidotransferase subunit C|uniref:Aspartyl/glutamyl-tRNA(Asn/Gln) amidotransferase subunit C n=1 Tax=Candidimonas humi TaxID=683355 RepID=A0ABV8P060_9BURK|nr:Asp-tRNA(Asn)/Glu-tRNA(Gln) amidotransferase subunit GatC [Candidimonas humi]MBV6305733.1 Asp-tRNA(Asn)/Glu-tRNA(Gln) amidotransferase subunit GatC [Candidimonas humi]